MFKRKPKVIDKEGIKKRNEFFEEIWKERPHISEISGDWLGRPALTTYFHHILPKSKYPQFEFSKENIILLTFEEHQQVESNMHRYEEINTRREQLLQKYQGNI